MISHTELKIVRFVIVYFSMIFYGSGKVNESLYWI